MSEEESEDEVTEEEVPLSVEVSLSDEVSGESYVGSS